MYPSYGLADEGARNSGLRKSVAHNPGSTYEITLTISRMLSVRLKVEFSRKTVAMRTVVFSGDKVNIDDEAIASTLAGSPAGNRPANRGPSLCQCWGRWTQAAEPVRKEKSESESTERPEHREKLGKDSKMLCQGSPIQEQNRA